MAKSITRVVYKPDPQSTDEYIIIVDPEEVRHSFQLTGFKSTHSLLV